jgi:hypothetical protein
MLRIQSADIATHSTSEISASTLRRRQFTLTFYHGAKAVCETVINSGLMRIEKVFNL